MVEDNLIYYGEAVKKLGDNKVGGYLVRFSSQDDPDLVGDYFSPETDLGIEDKSKLPVYYQHGYDQVLKSRRIGRAQATIDDIGVWLEAQLEMRDEYERGLMELAEAGKLGWSSGAAGHLVEREQVGKSWLIKSWPIAEASLTPTPAEPRNTAMSVKTLLDNTQETEKTQEVTMTDQVQTPEVKQEIDIDALVSRAADEAVMKFMAQEPEVKAGVHVVEDEVDRKNKAVPFTGPEFFKAVAMWDMGHGRDDRLKAFKATGLNEAVPSEGGFLVPPEIADGIYQNMWSVGNVLSQFTPIPVQSNNLTINAVDETSRADGSRMGGVRGYWMQEAATKTASKPKFRQIDLKLKKCAALVYATDELLADAGALQGWIAQNVPMELRFLVEAAIINGTGIGQPLGILQGGSLIQATRTNANEIDAASVLRMWARRYLGPQDYVWFANASIMPQLGTMTIGEQPVYQPPGAMSASPYGALLGRPVIETEYNPVLGTVGDLLLASPSQYAMIAQGGVEAASSIHVKFVEDETAFRFVFRVDGQPIWASAVTAYDGTTTISPFVALAATT